MRPDRTGLTRRVRWLGCCGDEPSGLVARGVRGPVDSAGFLRTFGRRRSPLLLIPDARDPAFRGAPGRSTWVVGSIARSVVVIPSASVCAAHLLIGLLPPVGIPVGRGQNHEGLGSTGPSKEFSALEQHPAAVRLPRVISHASVFPADPTSGICLPGASPVRGIRGLFRGCCPRLGEGCYHSGGWIPPKGWSFVS